MQYYTVAYSDSTVTGGLPTVGTVVIEYCGPEDPAEFTPEILPPETEYKEYLPASEIEFPHTEQRWQRGSRPKDRPMKPPSTYG